MLRTIWDGLTPADRRQWALDNFQRRHCAGGSDGHLCDEPAGTPWGSHWCAVHDDERLGRIRSNLESIRDDLKHKERS